MAERIYVRNEAGGLEPLMEKRFDTEDDLQALLAKYPELLDGEQMRPGSPLRWILITREQGIPTTLGAGDRWSVDHLVIDQDAKPTLVEVKRGESTDLRRTVVGQMLDYAAHAHNLNVTKLRETFEKQPDAEERLAKLLNDKETPDKFWQQVAENLETRSIRLLFVADAIPDDLARIVEFLNAEMNRIEVLAVEIKQFLSGTESQTLVPRVIGRLAKPNRSATALEEHPLYQEFWKEFLAAFTRDYKDWKVHRSTKGQKALTNSYLQLDAEGKAHNQMHYSFDYARREGDPTRVNFWVEPSNWGKPSMIEEAKHIVLELCEQKDEIERRFGKPLNWAPVEHTKWGIYFPHPDKNLAIGDRERWTDVRDWGIKHLGALRDAIQPHLDNM